jgi:hypothetical protein
MTGTIGDPPNRASKYEVIFKDEILLAVGGARTFDFTLFRVIENVPAIAFFNLKPFDRLDLQMRLKNVVFSFSYEPGPFGSPSRSVHEILRPNLVANGANRLEIRVNKGRCRIGDFVIWYHVR